MERTDDSRDWTRLYKRLWKKGDRLGCAFAELMHAWGLEVHYLRYSFFVCSGRGRRTLFFVTGTDDIAADPRDEILIHLELIRAAKDRDRGAYACHILDNRRHSLIRFVDLKRLAVRRTRGGFAAIDPDQCIPLDRMREVLRSKGVREEYSDPIGEVVKRLGA